MGEHWLTKQTWMAERCLFHRETPIINAQCYDVAYSDLISDPLAVVQKIYDFKGLKLHPRVLKKMADSLNINKQNKFGRHVYSLSDFAISAERVNRNFTAYRKKYNI